MVRDPFYAFLNGLDYLVLSHKKATLDAREQELREREYFASRSPKRKTVTRIREVLGKDGKVHVLRDVTSTLEEYED